jgi:hypothetical protein
LPKLFIVTIVTLLVIACGAIEMLIWFVKQNADTTEAPWAFIKVVSLGILGAGLGCAILFVCVSVVTALSLPQ